MTPEHAAAVARLRKALDDPFPREEIDMGDIRALVDAAQAAAQAPREVPRLTSDQIAKALAPLYSDPRAAEMGLPDDIRTARIVEGLVRELCGVAP